jgi:hypothetical protein
VTSLESLNQAIIEAERFIRKARAAREHIDEICGNKERAAAKRSSMDLTRALTEFRRS